MIYGYARVSTYKQAKDGSSLESQEAELRAHNAEKVIKEQYTGKTTKRPQLAALIEQLQPGDELIVTKLDRMARSVSEGLSLIQSLIDKGITVRVLNIGTMDNSPANNLILHVFLAFAQFERDLIIEITQQGRERASSKEGYKTGRPRKYSPERIETAIQLLENGYSYNQVAAKTGISKSTLIRRVKELLNA